MKILRERKLFCIQTHFGKYYSGNVHSAIGFRDTSFRIRLFRDLSIRGSILESLTVNRVRIIMYEENLLIPQTGPFAMEVGFQLTKDVAVVH